jgi:4-hydroxy-3-methylbut-2-enyl diphosphate reductase
VHPLWPEGPGGQPRRILITGGASCPDGVIQQVITRINSLFTGQNLHSIETVQSQVEALADQN